MKKSFVIIVNIIIMAAILIFVVSYSRFESRDSYNRQIEHFEDKTSRYAVILKAADRDTLMEEISAVKDKLRIQVETKDSIKGPVWE